MPSGIGWQCKSSIVGHSSKFPQWKNAADCSVRYCNQSKPVAHSEACIICTWDCLDSDQSELLADHCSNTIKSREAQGCCQEAYERKLVTETEQLWHYHDYHESW